VLVILGCAIAGLVVADRVHVIVAADADLLRSPTPYGEFWAGLANFVARWWWIGPAAVLGAWAASWIGRRAPWFAAPGGLTRWIPVVGAVVRAAEATAMCDLLRALVGAGAPLGESLRLAGTGVAAGPLRRAAERAATAIERGATNEETGRAAVGLPPLVQWLLAAGAQRELLGHGLRIAGETYRRRAERAAVWAAEYVPLALTLAIGGTMLAGTATLFLGPYVTIVARLAQALMGGE
jgi:type II secretory pathway component PulF